MTTPADDLPPLTSANPRVPPETQDAIKGALLRRYSGTGRDDRLLFEAADCIGSLQFDLIGARAASQPAQEPAMTNNELSAAIDYAKQQSWSTTGDVQRQFSEQLTRLLKCQALRAAAPPATQQQAEPAPGYCKHCKQYTIAEPLTADDEAVRLLRRAYSSLIGQQELQAAIDAYLAKAKPVCANCNGKGRTYFLDDVGKECSMCFGTGNLVL